MLIINNYTYIIELFKVLIRKYSEAIALQIIAISFEIEIKATRFFANKALISAIDQSWWVCLHGSKLYDDWKSHLSEAETRSDGSWNDPVTAVLLCQVYFKTHSVGFSNAFAVNKLQIYF